MSTLVPAILPVSREDLEQKLRVLRKLATDVQIDSVDGIMASPASWPYHTGTNPTLDFGDEGALPYLGRLSYEIDLMVRDPEAVAGAWVDAGADRIILHAESTNYLAQAIAQLQTQYGHAKDFAPGLLSLGIAFNVQTDVSVIEPFLDRVDFVQFMGIDSIGVQGQPFDPSVLRKIRAFRAKYPNVPVQVDGGVSLANLRDLLAVGVSRVIVGSAIWKSADVEETIGQFNEIIEGHGV